MTVYYVDHGDEDYNYELTTGTYDYTSVNIYVAYNNVLGTVHQGYAHIDTSGIPDGDVISAASVHLTEVSYTTSGKPAPTKVYVVQIYNPSTLNFDTLTNGTLTFDILSPRERSVSLTASEIACIVKTGETLFRVLVYDPGAGASRVFQYRAYETSQASAMHLDVTHAAPSGRSMAVIF